MPMVLAIRVRPGHRTAGPHAGLLHLGAGDSQTAHCLHATVILRGASLYRFQREVCAFEVKLLAKITADIFQIVHLRDVVGGQRAVSLHSAAILRFSFVH